MTPLAAHVADSVHAYGYGAVALAVGIESIGIPFPGEATLVAAALYAGATHRLDILGIVLAALAGAVIGDSIGFWLGRAFGLPLLRRFGPALGITPPRIRLGQYLVPSGTAASWCSSAGSRPCCGRWPHSWRGQPHAWPRFLAFNAAGGLAWSTLYGFGAYALGKQVHRLLGPLGIVLSLLTLLLLIAGFVLLRRNEARLQTKADRMLCRAGARRHSRGGWESVSCGARRCGGRSARTGFRKRIGGDGVAARTPRIGILSRRSAAFPHPARAVIDGLKRPLYRLYEARLARQVALRPVPRHVGLILDGNRRYAVREGLPAAQDAYRLGARKLDAIVEWCLELGIPAVTLWVFSTDNFARPPEQIAGILAAIEEKMQRLALDPHLHARRVRVRAIGRIADLPASTRASIRAAEQATAGYDGMRLSIAVAYGGHEEIADAVRTLLSQADAEGRTLAETAASISPESIARHLYLADTPEPDLIIRTSGEVRLSGFLLWQSARSEFYFTDVLWPAFRKIDFLRAVRAFQARKRRFGR